VATPDFPSPNDEDLCDIRRLRVIRKQCRSLFKTTQDHLTEQPSPTLSKFSCTPRSEISDGTPWLDRLERQHPERPLRSARLATPEFTVSGQSTRKLPMTVASGKDNAQGSKNLVKWLQRQVDGKENGNFHFNLNNK
jgi:hypothetical protein